MFDDFDTQIQCEEFYKEYEAYLALLDEDWEEPEEWQNNPNPQI